jgi:hypothetical protein
MDLHQSSSPPSTTAANSTMRRRSTKSHEDKNVRFTGSTEQQQARPGLVRQPHGFRHIDISTGMMTRRTQWIRLVTGAELPRSSWHKCRAFFGCGGKPSLSPAVPIDRDEENANHPTGLPRVPQYRIRSRSIGDKAVNAFDNVLATSFISDYLHWTFQATFLQVTLTSYVFFVTIILFFATILFWITVHQPECVVAGEGFVKTTYMDAFDLSWTTISTVGYGVIAPRVSTIQPKQQCVLFNMFMAIESFVGVLFGGITGAIIFGKVARVQSFAQVQFSDPMCVRYGTGVLPKQCLEEEENDDSEDDSDGQAPDNPSAPAGGKKAKQWPCPILEFRIINRLSGQKGGEIMNATVNIVATTLAKANDLDSVHSSRRCKSPRQSASLISKVSSVLHKPRSRTKQHSWNASSVLSIASSAARATKNTGAAFFGARKNVSNATGSILQKINHNLSRDHRLEESTAASSCAEAELEQELEAEVGRRIAETLQSVEVQTAALTSVAVDEGCDSTLAPRRIYHKLEIETDSHPFFKRVWNIRHVLNETSPLLSHKARRRIAENKGHWPDTWNNAASVRHHIRWSEIIVNFSGTANASGSSVYAQKVYDYVDLNVGYAFATILALDEKGYLVVDGELLNDVMEQCGGGGEDFQNVSEVPVRAVEFASQMAVDVTQRANSAAVRTGDAVKDAAVRTGDAVKHVVQRTFSKGNLNVDGTESSNGDLNETRNDQ